MLLEENVGHHVLWLLSDLLLYFQCLFFVENGLLYIEEPFKVGSCEWNYVYAFFLFVGGAIVGLSIWASH